MFLTKFNFVTCFLSIGFAPVFNSLTILTNLECTYTLFFHVVFKGFVPQLYSTLKQMKDWTNVPVQLHFFLRTYFWRGLLYCWTKSKRKKHTHCEKKLTFEHCPLSPLLLYMPSFLKWYTSFFFLCCGHYRSMNWSNAPGRIQESDWNKNFV